MLAESAQRYSSEVCSVAVTYLLGCSSSVASITGLRFVGRCVGIRHTVEQKREWVIRAVGGGIR